MKLDEEEIPCPDPVDTTETETGSNFRTGGSDQEGDRLNGASVIQGTCPI